MDKTIGIILIIGFIGFQACKKDDEVLTNHQLLAGTTADGKSWVIASQSLNGDPVTIGSCIADDVTSFYLSLIYIFDEGSQKCSADDPQTITGGWVFEENDTRLLISNGPDITDFEIVSLTSDELILKAQFLDLETVITFNPL